MKNEQSLRKSMRARQVRALSQARQIVALMDQQATEFEPTRMADIRDVLNGLNQSLHEFNAYHNALVTD